MSLHNDVLADTFEVAKDYHHARMMQAILVEWYLWRYRVMSTGTEDRLFYGDSPTSGTQGLGRFLQGKQREA